ncbi:MAG: thiamine diphosphokinase [Bacteroidales bacterium]|nr:thiamine diphosphokinase [Bacteroidales bacterium]
MNDLFFTYSDVVVVCNGQFPTHEIPLAILRQAKTIICCDGAIQKLSAVGVKPTVIVGDFDSLPKSLMEKYSDIIFHNPDQETNDLTKSMQWAKQHGFTDVCILGATGLREDHTLGNISLLADYEQQGFSVKMVTDSGVFTPVNHTHCFSSFKGQQVSIFSLKPDVPIRSENLKYPFNRPLPSWWCGTLNESLGEQFTLYFDEGKVLVYQTF